MYPSCTMREREREERVHAAGKAARGDPSFGRGEEGGGEKSTKNNEKINVRKGKGGCVGRGRKADWVASSPPPSRKKGSRKVG